MFINFYALHIPLYNVLTKSVEDFMNNPLWPSLQPGWLEKK